MMTIELDTDCLFNSHKWLTILDSSFPLRFETKRTIGNQMLTCCRCDGLPGKLLITLPFSDYLLFNGSLISILNRFQDWQGEYPGYAIVLRLGGYYDEQQLLPGWRVIRRGVFHRVAIDEPEIMHDRLSNLFKRNLGTAQKKGVDIRICQDWEGLERFYQLFARQRKEKFKILSPPRKLFQTMLMEYMAQNQGWVLEARFESQLLAALILLQHNDVMYYKYSASLPHSSKYCPNNLLLWTALNWAGQRQCRELDLGLSILDGHNDGLVRFKEGLGGAVVPVMNIRYEPESYDNNGEETNRELFRSITRFLTKMDMDANQIDAAAQILFHYFI